MALQLTKRRHSPHLYIRGTVRGQAVFESTGTADAIEGGTTPILLKVVFMRHSGPGRPRVQSVKAELIEGSVTIDETWGSGVMMNLVRVMERIRPFLDEGENANVC